jgi:hypothetical protein
MFCQVFPSLIKFNLNNHVLPNLAKFNINSKKNPCLTKFNLNSQYLPNLTKFNLNCHFSPSFVSIPYLSLIYLIDYIYVTRIEIVAKHMGQSEDHTTQVPPSQKTNNIPPHLKKKNINSTFQCCKVLIWPTCVIFHFWPKGMKYGQTKVTSFFALIIWGACCITSLVNQN